MGKLTSFYVAFNNEQTVFNPGSFVAGTVVIALREAMDMKAVKLKFHGFAYVRWSESSGSGKNRRTRTYTARETYFDQAVIVYGKGSGGASEGNKTLPGGQSVFPFQFQLPANLPSSFEGLHGHVRFFVKASIDKPWKFDHNTKRAFTVLDLVDLNFDPTARNVPALTDSKTLCCMCCASGPIEAQVRLDRTGYAPGEFIYITATVDNASSSDMPSTSASIIQTVIFKSTSKSRTRSNEICKITGPGCKAGSSCNWSNERIQIPPLPPSMLRFCNIIIINYSVQFCVETPGTSINLRVPVPITIGSIPLQGLTPYNMPPPVANPSAPPPPETTNFQAPPPSYASAVGEAVNIRDEDDNDYLMGETSYAPQYAYYDWSKPAFTYNN